MLKSAPALTLLALAFGCGDPVGSDGPGQDPSVDPGNVDNGGDAELRTRTLSDRERQALTVALGGVGFFGPMQMGANPTEEFREVGQIEVSGRQLAITTGGGSEVWEGTGMQLDFYLGEDPTSGEAFQFQHTGVIAWTGLDVDAQTVDEAVIVFADGIVDAGSIELGQPDPATWSSDWTGGIAIVYDGDTGESYLAEEGTFEIDEVSFDSEEDCLGAVVVEVDGDGIDATCAVSTGTLDGSFDVTAEGPAGDVDRAADFSVPAMRLTVEITDTSTP